MTAPAPEVRTRFDPHDDTDFAAMLAEHWRRSPWLLLSAAAHGVVVILLWILLPAEAPRPEEQAVSVVLPDEQPQLQPIVPPPPEAKVEPPLQVDPQLVDAVEPLETTDAIEAFVDAPTLPTAFTGKFDDSVLGVSGNAGPHGGPHGARTRGGRGSPTNPQLRLALGWLVDHQDDDGRWDCDGFMKHDREGAPCDGAGNSLHDVGVTGLAMLAFLGEGSTLRQGEFKEPLRKGARWLKDQQAENGLFGAAAASDYVYDHAIATYAMSEACGLSNSRVLRAPAENGLAYLAWHRNPYGAWRYQPRDGDSDTSVTGWCVLALASGKSLGLQVDDAALRAALAFLDSCTGADGRCGYTRAGEPSSRRPGDHGTRFPPERGEALTAVGLFCRYFLRQRPDEEPRMAAAAAVLAKKPPVWDVATGAVDHYYWYYGTHAMYQVGGPQWRAWSKQLDAAVVRTQRTDGNFRGSWDPAGAWGEDGGRVYSTAVLALCLQAHYRYTRLVR